MSQCRQEVTTDLCSWQNTKQSDSAVLHSAERSGVLVRRSQQPARCTVPLKSSKKGAYMSSLVISLTALVGVCQVAV